MVKLRPTGLRHATVPRSAAEEAVPWTQRSLRRWSQFLTTLPPDDLPPGAREFLAFIEERITETAKLFASDGERAGALFGALSSRGKSWKKPKLCSYRGCTQKSIRRSHTIQKSGPLSSVADATSHVLTPTFTENGMSLELKGLSDASTFAGFCNDHERLFDPFELTGLIQDTRDLGLQVFRSLCRELSRTRQDLKHLQDLRADLAERLDSEVRKEAARLKVDLKSYTYQGGAFAPLDRAIVERREVLSWLEAAYDDHFPVIDGSGVTKLAGTAQQTDMPLPVALSGLAFFEADGVVVTTIVGVIPQGGGTLIYMVGRHGDEARITTYLASKEYDLLALDMVEAWMIRSTDHWFLKPDVWNAIPSHRQAVLLQEMSETDHGVTAPPSTSIFDDLRKAALAVPMNPAMPPDLQAYVARQRAKLT